MPDISNLIQQGTLNLWIFIPTAILLGALHGLEPGHSKTMMAAFIIAVRGTVRQAVLLGLAATISHTAVVWVVVMTGLYLLKGNFDAATTEPYFQAASGILMVCIAAWLLYRTWKHQHNFMHEHTHHHHHAEHHVHHHHDHHGDGHLDKHLDKAAPEYHDAHELAHARDIEQRFTGQKVTTAQIIMFGLTGGLVPCPASITILLLCLQIKKFALGALLVSCFSIGLAVTMVTAGAIAALSIGHITKRWPGFSIIARKAPYLSGILIILIGLYVSYSGLGVIMDSK